MLTERFQRALGKAFGDEHADADPVIRPSQFADFQANAALALAKKLGEKPRDVAERIVEHLDLDGVAEAPEISGPGFVNVRLTSAWIAAELTRARRPPRRTDPGPAGHPRRLLRAQRGQGDARRTPAHDRRRRRAGADARAPRPRRGPAEPRRRLGHAVRHAHRAPAGRRRGLPRGAAAGHRPQHVLRRRARGVRRRPGVRRPGPHPRGRAAGRRPRHPAALGRAGRPLQAVLQPHLRDPRRHPDRRRPGRRVDVQRRARADLRRARGRGAGDDERRRPVRVPRRLHRPRGQAGTAHHPQVRRRLRLRDDRPRHDPAPGPRPEVRPHPLRHRRPAGAAPQHGLGHRPQGRLAARRRRGRARPDRQRARSGPQDPAYPRRQPAQADGPARGGRSRTPARSSTRRGPTSTPASARRSRRRSASGP